MMTIVVTGGGSGGHITPILAVASELKRLNHKIRIIYIGQTGDGLGDIPAHDPNIDKTYTIRAGKFRRYHGEGLKQLLDLRTMYLNIRDGIYLCIGLVQSIKLMGKLKPDIVFSRGGFVSVPVALGAAIHRIPYITHDSDPIPSLTNRIIAPWATFHAVALPKDIYSYPTDKTMTTGIPLAGAFRSVDVALKRAYRKEVQIPDSAQLLFIIGGGLGSQRVNRAVGEMLPHLLREFKGLHVVHVVGRINEAEMEAVYHQALSEEEQGRVQCFGFLSDVYRYSGASDVIITRAGATNLAEFAVQGKACIVVPSPFLTGGHQLKNAQFLADREAAVVIDEYEVQDDPNRLAKQVSILLRDDTKRKVLESNFAEFAQPDAAGLIANILLDKAKKPKRG